MNNSLQLQQSLLELWIPQGDKDKQLLAIYILLLHSWSGSPIISLYIDNKGLFSSVLLKCSEGFSMNKVQNKRPQITAAV